MSETASIRSGSSGSSISLRYRKVSNESVIDHNLFGPPNREKQKKTLFSLKQKKSVKGHLTPPSSSSSSSPSSPSSTSLCKKRQSASSSKSVLAARMNNGNRSVNEVSLTKLEAMKQRCSSSFSSPSEQKNHHVNDSVHEENTNPNSGNEHSSNHDRSSARRNDEKDRKAARALARKQHMLKLEEEKGSPLNIDSEAKKRRSDYIRRKAQEKMDSNEDIVKLLNTYSQRAQAFAIRDQQVLDKKEQEKRELDYEKRLDVEMEMDRLKEIQKREQTELSKIKKRIDDRKVIEHQIEERRQMKLLQEEEREQENKQMLQTIQKYQQEELEKQKERKEEARKAQREVIKLNEVAVTLKRKCVLDLKKEEEEIIAYQKAQDEKLRKREMEEERLKKEKQELQKKMLESQTRTLDKKAELDELRARRAMEEKERMFRQKDLMKAQEKQKQMLIMNEARKKQLEELHQKKELEKVRKNEEYINAMNMAEDMSKRELDEQKATELKNAKFRQELLLQIKKHETVKDNKKKEKFRQGLEIKEKIANDCAKLEHTREKVVNVMKSKGIDEKYLREVKSININKMFMK